MLYKNDKNEDEISNRYVLDYENNKLNIKKVIGVVLTVIIFAACLIGIVFFVLNKSINNNKISTIENSTANEVETEVVAVSATVYPHSGEKIMNSFLPQENPNAQDEIKALYHSSEKVVYFTFDDGPSTTITPKLLDLLKEENVPATFFVLGKCVEDHPELVKREFDEGHFVANHGYTHSYASIYKSSDAVYNEYVQCEKAVQIALDNPNYHTRLFRFPGGSSGGKYHNLKQQAKDYMWSKGIANTNWNALNGDAEGVKGANNLYNRMVETVGRQGTIILLMHDAADKKDTLEYLPRAIKYFRDRGYTFKNFYEIY